MWAGGGERAEFAGTLKLALIKCPAAATARRASAQQHDLQQQLAAEEEKLDCFCFFFA